MKYMVVIQRGIELHSAIGNMNKQIESWLSCGWKPQGGISIALEPHSSYQTGTLYCLAQAMVKEC